MGAVRIGDQGERVVVAGVVLSVEPIFTEYGNGTLIKMRTAEGALVYWRSSHAEYAWELQPGDPLTVRATIDRYKLINDELWCRITNGRVDDGALALV